MQAEIKTIPTLFLMGHRLRMSVAQPKIKELWQGFMPVRHQIPQATTTDLYSVEVYPDLAFFTHFDPQREFEKWAAIPVAGEEVVVPDGFTRLVIPTGKYAVFRYRGKASDAPAFYQRIFREWLPDSPYSLADRPHFAVMGAAYKGEDPDSEEDLWLPITE